MLLGFKRRFAPHVWDGTKTHTIRLKRVRRPKVGEICNCYVDPRQITMALLGRWECTRVEDITITAAGGIAIANAELDPGERNLFCWRDGFRPSGSTADAPGDAFGVFMEYWTAEAKGIRAFPFEGDVIHWAFRDLEIGPGFKTGRAPRPVQI